MNFKMYSSTLAILVALSACSSSEDTATTVTPPTVTPPTEVPPSGPTTGSDGTTNSYSNDADDRTTTLSRQGGFRVTNPSALSNPESNQYNASVDNVSRANDFVNSLAALGDLDTAGKVASANQLIVDFDAIPATNPDVAVTFAIGDTTTAALASMQGVIDGSLNNRVGVRADALSAANNMAAETAGRGFDEITLADGTVLQTASWGNTQAGTEGAYVSSRVVAAYEEDSLGRITRVAFVEASGIDFTASDYTGNGAGNYVASGVSGFAVKVDDGFFDEFYGTSDLTINLARESGDVRAAASSADTGATVRLRSDVVYNPITGTFSAANGELIYRINTGTGTGSGVEVVTASNAQILGQLHGDMSSQFGADFTGIVTSNTDRIEAVGAIIGEQTP
mgnify:CR=1 FL=1